MSTDGKVTDIEHIRDVAKAKAAILSSPETVKPNGAAVDEKKRQSQADQLVEIATGEGVELFHSSNGDAYASIAVSGHRETWPLKSTGFKN